MDTVLEKNQTKDRHIRILASISVVAFLFGLTSIRVGITNDFISFGLHFDALQTNVLSYLNITLGICYLMVCALVLSQRKWSLTLAFIFLMLLRTKLHGKTYEFPDLRVLMGKANEEKSGDRLAGVAAETAAERVAARLVLAEVPLWVLHETPAAPYDQDEVTRVIHDAAQRTHLRRDQRLDSRPVARVDSGRHDHGRDDPPRLERPHRRDDRSA
jgi:hypothetical protein